MEDITESKVESPRDIRRTLSHSEETDLGDKSGEGASGVGTAAPSSRQEKTHTSAVTGPLGAEVKRKTSLEDLLRKSTENKVTISYRTGAPGSRKVSGTISLPVLNGTIGPDVIDIRTLPGLVYDPGFSVTSSCISKITYIDGPNGVLLHRGYPIEQLVEKATWFEMAYLIIHGELPTATEANQFERDIKSHMMVHESMIQFYKGYKSDAHPMSVLLGVVSALSAYFHDSMDVHDEASRALAVYRITAKMPTIAAMAFKMSVGEPIVYPRMDLSFSENLLYMMFARPTEPYEINPVFANAVETFLKLHADHGQNASTSTVRIAGSSHANPFAAIACGIAALWGPMHGSANEAVVLMLREIGTVDNIPKFIAKAKDKSDPFRLSGFGHRVYKNYDPRARMMKVVAAEVLAEVEKKEKRIGPMFELAKELEKIALEDEYFISRKLFPNVDFYSGVVLSAIGVPTNMFTVFFAVGRAVGWGSQWQEMMSDENQKISRPRQLYVGAKRRDVVSLTERDPEGVRDVRAEKMAETEESSRRRRLSVHIKSNR